jgi:LysM repeat protein/ABC-type branched-subunit amino acid transport system substrate-binding protein
MVNKLAFIFIFALFAFEGNCQPTVKISEETKTIDHKTYYVHTVEQGQTLYSISKAYRVPQDEILSINQMSSPNLTTGQKILILKSDEIAVNGNEFIMHQVAPGETLFGLAQRYEVGIEEMIKLNPEARYGIKTGQILKIRNKNYSQNIVPDNEAYYYHTVQKDNTLYSISKFYSISTEDIILLNPELKNGLKEGQVLKLPKDKINLDLIQNVDTVDRYANLYFEEEGITPCKDFSYNKEMVFNIVMMLPLYLDKNIYYLGNYKDHKDVMFFKNSQRFLEIYEGAMIALNRLKSEGLSLNLKVIDTNNDESIINEFLNTCNPKKIDLIIGPVHSADLKIVSEFAQKNRINVISPLSTEKEIALNNPFVFQMIPATETVLKNTAESVKINRDSSIVFIHTDSFDETEYIKLFQMYLSSSDSIDAFIPEIQVINFTNEGSKAIENALKSNVTNTIVVSSTDEVFVSQILDILERLSRDKRIKLFLPQKTENFQNTTFNHLSKLNVHYISSTYIDYTSPEVQSFIEDYRSVFHTEPTLTSFEGYDMVYYFSNALRNYGRHFQFCFQENPNLNNKPGIVFKLNFQRVSETGGFENIESYILKYNDRFQLINVMKK